MPGVDPPDRARLRRLASAAFSLPRIAAPRARVQAIADRLLDDREACGDTVVDLSRASLPRCQLAVAGQDITTSLIGNWTVAPPLHPGTARRDRRRPSSGAHAIEEILRWDAPVPRSTFRYTTQDVAFGGTVIPAFAQVIISVAAANRDLARYDNPETAP